MDDERYELSDDWQDWVLENALNGASVDELIGALIEEGISPTLAHGQITSMLSSRTFELAIAWRRKALRLQLVNDLKHALHIAHAPSEIERKAGVSPQELSARYLSACQPVILTDVIDKWPALTRWTDDYLKSTLGHLEVTCCKGRERVEDPCVDIERFYTDMSFADFIDEVASAGVSNDLYLVGNNRFLEREGAERLFDDIDDEICLYLSGPVRADRANLWLGPAGTLTELHHDPTTVLYAQVRGEKRFRLLSPHSEAPLFSAQKTYSLVNIGALEADQRERVYEVTLRPGELLLLPAGWWHEVTALSASISLGFLNVQGRTSFPWYYPGRLTGVGEVKDTRSS